MSEKREHKFITPNINLKLFKSPPVFGLLTWQNCKLFPSSDRKTEKSSETGSTAANGDARCQSPLFLNFWQLRSRCFLFAVG